MSNFSERIGVRAKKSVVQTDDIDRDLRVGLWNVLQVIVLDTAKIHRGFISKSDPIFLLLELVWINHFKRPVDSLSSYWKQTYDGLRGNFFGAEWFEVYDLVEYVVQHHPDENSRAILAQHFNRVLAAELSAFRFVDLQLVRITSDAEIAAVESAIESGDRDDPHVVHLSQALVLLSNRDAPDYRNSIKESISAVEAVCQLVTGNPKANLSDALKELENNGSLHSAFKGAIVKLYGWTSDSGGIRHALNDGVEPDQADAVFMLVACSAFVSYLIAKSAV